MMGVEIRAEKNTTAEQLGVTFTPLSVLATPMACPPKRRPELKGVLGDMGLEDSIFS